MLTHWIKGSDGREWPIRFTQATAIKLAVEENVPMNKLGKFLGDFSNWPIGRVYRFYRLAFESGATKEGRSFDMTESEFIEWVATDDKIMEGIIKVMSASSPDPEEKKTEARG